MSGNPPAGYYADPSIPGYIRYWDGNTWVTGTSRPAPTRTQGPDVVEDARESSAAAAEAWRPRPDLEASQEAVARPAAAQPAAAGQAVPEQFQQQYLPEQSAPAQAPGPSYPQATQQIQQIPQQFAAPQQFAPPDRPQIPQQYQPAAPQQAAPVEPQRPETIVGLVVPSAFGGRGGTGLTGAYAYGGPANPFAGLPGIGEGAAERALAAQEGETTVLELATPGSRLLARIIDLGIAAVFSAPLTVSLLLIAHRHDHTYVLNLDAQATTTYTTLGMDGLGIALWGGAALALVLVAILYEGYRLGRGGQTAGMRLAGIRVVRLADARPVRGGGLGLRRALLFWVLAVLPLVDLLALGGVLWGRPYRQGLHERATSTATVRA